MFLVYGAVDVMPKLFTLFENAVVDVTVTPAVAT